MKKIICIGLVLLCLFTISCRKKNNSQPPNISTPTTSSFSYSTNNSPNICSKDSLSTFSSLSSSDISSSLTSNQNTFSSETTSSFSSNSLSTSSSSEVINYALVTLSAGIFTEYFSYEFSKNDTPCKPIVNNIYTLKIYSLSEQLSIKSITVNGTQIFSTQGYVFKHVIQNFTATDQIDIVVEFYKDGDNY